MPLLTVTEFLEQHYAKHPEKMSKDVYPMESMAALATMDEGMKDLLDRAHEYYVLKTAK